MVKDICTSVYEFATVSNWTMLVPWYALLIKCDAWVAIFLLLVIIFILRAGLSIIPKNNLKKQLNKKGDIL